MALDATYALEVNILKCCVLKLIPVVAVGCQVMCIMFEINNNLILMKGRCKLSFQFLHLHLAFITK